MVSKSFADEVDCFLHTDPSPSTLVCSVCSFGPKTGSAGSGLASGDSGHSKIHLQFASWLAAGKVFRGWAHSASGDTAEDLSWIEDGIADWRATGSKIGVPYWLALKVEALHLADRAFEALEATREAQALAERSEERWWCAELHRLRGVFLAAMGAEEAQIEASFCAAISTATEQKSVSQEKRAEATYAAFGSTIAVR